VKGGRERELKKNTHTKCERNRVSPKERERERERGRERGRERDAEKERKLFLTQRKTKGFHPHREKLSRNTLTDTVTRED
jgi:hypothetical protein